MDRLEARYHVRPDDPETRLKLATQAATEIAKHTGRSKSQVWKMTIAEVNSMIDELPPRVTGADHCSESPITSPSASTRRDVDAGRKGPPLDAITCYRVWFTTGKTQKEIAARLSPQLARPVTQGQVSRWLKEVRDWLEAGNVLPDLFTPVSRPHAQDPRVLEMGPRLDRLTSRQRQRRLDDSDN
jgi:hypothetical protein